MTIRTFTLRWTVLVTAALIALGSGCARRARERKPPIDPVEMRVQTIKPRQDPNFILAVQEPAYVEGFYQAKLMAQAGGPVKYLVKDIGDVVVKGEHLLVVEVPQRVQDVAQKQAAIVQSRASLIFAQDMVKSMEAAVEVAEATIESARAYVKSTEATMVYRQSEYNRFVILAKRNAVTADVVDETLKSYQAAVASWEAAKADVKKAKAAYEEAKAKLESARADVTVKQATLDVAVKNRDYAQAMLDLATIRAPFDGVLIQRNVNPGSFVADATNAATDPLLVVARIDIVTVYMKVPDNFAPYVAVGTPAFIQMDELPGELIAGRVTRFAPAIDPKDRTLRVEVDLFNDTEAAYRRYVASAVQTFLTPLGATTLPESMVLRASARTAWSPNMKGWSDPLATLPAVRTRARGVHPRPLWPGMYGRMRLNLHPLPQTYLLPSGTVFSRGGKTYIWQVKEGKVHLVPVRVQIDDGTLAKVAIVLREANPRLGVQEILQDFTGQEEIVAGNQGQFAEGQPVQPVPTEWKAP
jgi:multidrug resistance efflux pump